MKEVIQLQNVRISYPHLLEARAIQPGQQAKFSAAFWVAKGSDDDNKVRMAINTMLLDAKAAKIKLVKVTPYYDGADKVGPEAADYMILNSASTRKPAVVDRDTTPITDAETIYPGCHVNAYLALYDYQQPTGNGLAFGLNGVQFVGDGERLDGGVSAVSMFEPVDGAPEPINSAFM